MNWLALAGAVLDCVCLGLLVLLAVGKCRNKNREEK